MASLRRTGSISPCYSPPLSPWQLRAGHVLQSRRLAAPWAGDPTRRPPHALPPRQHPHPPSCSVVLSSLSSSYSTSSSSSSWPQSSSSSSSRKQQTEATHVSVRMSEPPHVYTAADCEPGLRFLGYIASASISAVALFHSARHYSLPRTTVLKLQVALLGLAKSFQKDLNEIAEKVEDSNQR